MSNSTRQPKSNIQGLLERAQEALADSLALIEQGGSPEGISSRAWSAMSFAILAVLRAEGNAVSEADAVLDAFEKVLAKRKAAAGHGKAAREARELAAKAESELGPRVTNDEAFATYNAAVELVAAADALQE